MQSHSIDFDSWAVGTHDRGIVSMVFKEWHRRNAGRWPAISDTDRHSIAVSIVTVGCKTQVQTIRIGRH